MVQFVALFIFTFSSGPKVTTESVSFVHCNFKNRFYIHYLIRT